MTELLMRQESHDFSSGEETERKGEVEELSRDLLRDFYQTFRLSQGETGPQKSLMYLLSLEHQLSGHTGIMVDALGAARDGLDRLTIPARHIEASAIEQQYSSTGFRNMWRDYEEELQNWIASEDLNEAKQESEYSIYMALNTMLKQELKYQDKGRPNRPSESDPYESIVREYIFGNRLTGSDQLQAVRGTLEAYLRKPPPNTYGDTLSEKLRSLIEKWEANHPGESFLPEAETSDLETVI